MNPSRLKGLLQDSGRDLINPTGPVGVVVDLNTSEASRDCLDRLAGLGLSVDRVIHNKVVGTVDGSRLSTLHDDPDVKDVEVSTPLKPH